MPTLPNFTMPQQAPLDSNNLPAKLPNFTIPDNRKISPEVLQIPESFTLGEQYAESYDIGKHYQIPLGDWRGEMQGRLEKWGRAVPRFATRFLGQVAATPAYLLAAGQAALTDTTLADALDTNYLNTIENFDRETKEYFEIYAPKSVREGGLWDNLSSASFWTNDATDAAAFFASMFAGPAALKGLGMVGKLGRALNMSNKGMANLEMGTMTVMNTVAESMAESSEIANKLREELNLMVANNQIDQEEADKRLAEATSNTALANIAILALPNLMMNKLMLGRFTPEKSSLTRILSNEAGIPVKDLTPLAGRELAKRYAKTIGAAFLSEGFFEEGFQGTTQKINERLALTGQDLGGMAEFASEYTDFITSIEGQKAVALGGIIGGIAGGVGAKRQLAAEDKSLSKISKLIQQYWTGFGADVEGLITPEGGLNLDKVPTFMSEMFKEHAADQMLQIAGALGEKDAFEYLHTLAFTRLIAPMLNIDGAEVMLDQALEYSSKKVLEGTKSLGYSAEQEQAFIDSRKSLVRNLQKKSQLYRNILDGAKLEGGTLEEQSNYINQVRTAALQEFVRNEFIRNRLSNTKQELELLRSKLNLIDNKAFSEFLDSSDSSTLESEELKYLNNKVKVYETDLKNSEENVATFFDNKELQKGFSELIKNAESNAETAAEVEAQVQQAVSSNFKFKLADKALEESGINWGAAFAAYQKRVPNSTPESFTDSISDKVSAKLEEAEDGLYSPEEAVEALMGEFEQLGDMALAGGATNVENALRALFNLPQITTQAAQEAQQNPPPAPVVNSATTSNRDDIDVLEEQRIAALNDVGGYEDLDNPDDFEGDGERQDLDNLVSGAPSNVAPAPAPAEPAPQIIPIAGSVKEEFNGIQAFKPFGTDSNKLSTIDSFLFTRPWAHSANPTGYTFEVSPNSNAGKIFNLTDWTGGIAQRRGEAQTIKIMHDNIVVGYVPDPDVYIHPKTGAIVEIDKISKEEYYSLFPADPSIEWQSYEAVKAAYLNNKALVKSILSSTKSPVTLADIGGKVFFSTLSMRKISPKDNLTTLYAFSNRGRVQFTDEKSGAHRIIVNSPNSWEVDDTTGELTVEKKPATLLNSPAPAVSGLGVTEEMREALDILGELQDKGLSSRYVMLVPHALGTVTINQKPHTWVAIIPKRVANPTKLIEDFAAFARENQELQKENPADILNKQIDLSRRFREQVASQFFIATDSEYILKLRIAFGKLQIVWAHTPTMLTSPTEEAKKSGMKTLDLPNESLANLDTLAKAINDAMVKANPEHAAKTGVITADSFKAQVDVSAFNSMSSEEFITASNDTFGSLLNQHVYNPSMNIVVPVTATPVATHTSSQKSVLISDDVYNKFIDTGQIPEYVIDFLAVQVMDNIPLNPRELEVFTAKTAEINAKIVEFSALPDESSEVTEEDWIAEHAKAIEAAKNITPRDFQQEYDTLSDIQKTKFHDLKKDSKNTLTDLELIDYVKKCY